MTQELRERVAEKLRHTYGEPKWLAFADAAIAIIRAETLEEAASLVAAHAAYSDHAKSIKCQEAMISCAAAIRALKDRNG